MCPIVLFFPFRRYLHMRRLAMLISPTKFTTICETKNPHAPKRSFCRTVAPLTRLCRAINVFPTGGGCTEGREKKAGMPVCAVVVHAHTPEPFC